jgi:hypothetical protein
MLRPKVKPEHAPYRIAGGTKIRIGGVSYGLAAEIADPGGWVWAMLSAMDGSRGVAEIVRHVHARYPDQSVDTLERGVRQLLDSGYVEDAAGPVPPGLTERDMCRYDRAVRYFRWLDLTPRATSWEPQARLREARVTILGVGGAGGVAALALAASGVGSLHCVDSDEVELSGDFISVPDVAHRVLVLLGQGRTVAEVAATLRAEMGVGFAVADFVAALDELGFLAAVDERVREDSACPRPGSMPSSSTSTWRAS